MENNFDLILSILKDSKGGPQKSRPSFRSFRDLYVKHRLFVNLGVLVLFFFINCFAGWFSYVVFPLLAIMTVVDSLENGITYIVFAIPFCLLNPYASLIIFLCTIALYAVKFFFIFFAIEKEKPNWTELIFVALFVGYALLPIGPYSLGTLFKIAISLTLFSALFILARRRSIVRFEFNIRALACSVIISSIFGLLIFVSPYLRSIMVVSEAGGLFRYQALMSNTNGFAMICEIVLAFLAYLTIKGKKCLINCLLFLGVALAGFFTFSKLFYITLVIILIAFFIGMLFVNWKKTLIATSIILLLGGIAFLVIYFKKPDILQYIVSRFGNFSGSLDQIMNQFTTTRWTLWKKTFSFWGTNPFFFFFGRGLGAGTVPGLEYSAHNLYISCIDQLGIVGACLFVVPIILLIRDAAKSAQTKISKAVIIPFIVLAVMFMSEDLLFFNGAY